MNAMECIEYYGVKQGLEACKDFYDDFLECSFQVGTQIKCLNCKQTEINVRVYILENTFLGGGVEYHPMLFGGEKNTKEKIKGGNVREKDEKGKKSKKVEGRKIKNGERK